MSAAESSHVGQFKTHSAKPMRGWEGEHAKVYQDLIMPTVRFRGGLHRLVTRQGDPAFKGSVVDDFDFEPVCAEREDGLRPLG
jgi:hypothetical protein